jgi:hypothetical protein
MHGFRYQTKGYMLRCTGVIGYFTYIGRFYHGFQKNEEYENAFALICAIHTVNRKSTTQ